MSSNVSPIANQTSATIEDAKKWIAGMGERGSYSEKRAKDRQSAIDCLAAVLTPDEHRTAQAFISNLKDITARWATKNHANPETARAYESRARAGLSDYLEYLRNPVGFKPRPPKQRAGERRLKAASVDANPQKKQETLLDHMQPTSAPAPSATTRRFPVGNESSEFAFTLPTEGLTVRDVLKITCHLVTFARDFDPTNPSQARIFSLVPSDEGGPGRSNR